MFVCSMYIFVWMSKRDKGLYPKIEVENYGTITLKLDGKTAPITVQNFVDLAEFYDGLTVIVSNKLNLKM